MQLDDYSPGRLYSVAHQLFSLWGWTIGLTLVGLGTADVVVPLPRLLTQLESGAPLSLFASGGIAVALIRSFRSEGTALELVYGRRSLLKQHLLALVALAATGGLLILLSLPLIDRDDAAVFARNTTMLCAVALLVARVAPPVWATAAPMIIVIVTGTMGRSDVGRPSTWAVLLHSPTMPGVLLWTALSGVVVGATIGSRRAA